MSDELESIGKETGNSYSIFQYIILAFTWRDWGEP
jgi:hypothetical protein